MPRITVTTETPAREGQPTVLLDEQVRSIHLDTGHAAAQLVERLAWAIVDAEYAETPADQTTQAGAPIATNDLALAHSRARRQIRSPRRIASFTGVRIA